MFYFCIYLLVIFADILYFIVSHSLAFFTNILLIIIYYPMFSKTFFIYGQIYRFIICVQSMLV